MSTVARPRLAVRSPPAPTLVPCVICVADVLALEVAFVLGLGVRRLLASWLPAEIGPTQYLGVAAGLLLLPLIYY